MNKFLAFCIVVAALALVFSFTPTVTTVAPSHLTPPGEDRPGPRPTSAPTGVEPTLNDNDRAAGITCAGGECRDRDGRFVPRDHLGQRGVIDRGEYGGNPFTNPGAGCRPDNQLPGSSNRIYNCGGKLLTPAQVEGGQN